MLEPGRIPQQRFCRIAALSILIGGIAVGGVPISPSTAPAGAVGTAYSQLFQCDCGGGTVWSYSGSLPPGLNLQASSGLLSGTPTAGGTYSFTISVVDGDISGSQSYTVAIIEIQPGPPLANGATGISYSLSFTVLYGSGSYSWSSFNAPPGLKMSSGGVLSGIPTTVGTFVFNVNAAPVAGAGPVGPSVSATFQLTVVNPLKITSSVIMPNGVAGLNYSQVITASGGTQPYTFTLEPATIAPNVLPAGLSLNAGGLLSGIPTKPGNYGFTIDVTDSTNNTLSTFFSLIVAPAFSITAASPLQTGSLQAAYTQAITATGGNQPYTFTTTAGQLPPGLLLQTNGSFSGSPTSVGTYTFTVQVTDNFGYSVTKQFQLSIAAAGPQLQVSPLQLSFSAVVGGDDPAPQSLAITAPSNAAVNYAAQVLPVSGATPAWITIAPASGSAPGAVKVTVSVAKLTPSNYQATIQITVPNNTSQAPINVAVNFAVTGTAPTLGAAPAFLHFTAHASAPSTQEQIVVASNIGGSGTPIVSVVGSSPWISTSVTAATVRVDVNSQGLGVGSYHDIVRVNGANGSVDVPVSLFVQDVGPAMALSVSGLRFQARQGAGSTMPQSVTVFNIGDSSSTVNWVVDLVSGSDWLAIANGNGTATASKPGKFTLMPAASTANLPAGPRYALVRVSDPQSLGSPRYLTAVLDNEPATSAALPDPSPAGLFFASSTGAQTVFVYTSSATPAAFGVSTATTDGASWLSATPLNGTASTGQPAQLSVSVNATSLAPGIYFGTVNLEMNGVLRTVDVTLVVLQPSSSTVLRPDATAACTPAQLAMTQTGLAGNFAVPAGWPATLIVQLNDNCGNAVSNGAVVASFSTGDPPLSLAGDGVSNTYSATWQPISTGPETTVTLRGAAGALQATEQIIGAVSQNSNAPPSLVPNGALNIFFNVAAANTVGYALAPGSVIQVYGSGLAPALNSPGQVPLLNQISNTFMLIGSTEVPLFFVAGSVLAAQVPFELTPNRQYQTIVSANGALTLPQPLDLVPMQPGVDFSIADGSVVAQRLDGTLVSASAPAKPGDVLTLYLTGLGATNPPVTSGTPTPLEQVPATSQPMVTLDGENLNVLYAGLTPTGIGLYQISFTVPLDARSGNLALVITQNGATANATTLAVSH